MDSKTSYEIISLLEELNKQGKTVVIITHDLSIAQRCSRVIEIVDGKITYSLTGSMAEEEFYKVIDGIKEKK